MASTDPFNSFDYTKQMNKALQSAFVATPAVYRIMDQFATMVDSFSNSQSLNVIVDTAEKILKFGDLLTAPNGALTGLENQLAGLLQTGIIQNLVGGGQGGHVAKARQQMQQEQMKQLLERKQEQLELRMQWVAEIAYFNNMQKEITLRSNNLMGSDMASINGYSDEKLSADQDLAYTAMMHPEDLELNA